MARVALLIGTGTYGDGFKPLPAAPKDVEAIATVLRDPEMGGFDQVEQLIDQPYGIISETIETWFRARQKDDLALLYISGHGVQDAQLDLYFAACDTKKQKEDLVRATAISASFVRDRIRESKAKRQVVILDCCFSGAFGDLLTKDDDTIDLTTLLGAEGRVVLTSSGSRQYSFEHRDGLLSIYTRYLVEGIRTGAADVDNDGAISVQELHDYAKRKVQEESPAMTPRIIVLKDEGYQIRIAKAPLGDPKVKYRKEVEAIIQEDGGTIDEICSRPVLEEWQQKLGLSDGETQAIEAEILEPIRQRQKKIQRYREVFTRAIQHKNPLGERERKRLKQLQQVLGLGDENIQAIEAEVLSGNGAVIPSDNLLRKIQILKDEINFIEGKITQAERSYDLNLAAELRYGKVSQLLLELASLEAELSHRDSTSNPSTVIRNLGATANSDVSSDSVDELSSEKGIAFSKLRDLLKAGKWQEADQETSDRMLQAMNKKNWWDVESNDLLNFPCKDLKTINRLWVHYSNGHFGFSVQKKIYVDCGGKLDGKYPGNEIWYKFCDRVGWRKNNSYVNYSDLKFNPSISLQGELPFGSVYRDGLMGGLVSISFLAQRLVKCSR